VQEGLQRRIGTGCARIGWCRDFSAVAIIRASRIRRFKEQILRFRRIGFVAGMTESKRARISTQYTVQCPKARMAGLDVFERIVGLFPL